MFFGPACDDISDLFNVWKTLLADTAMKETLLMLTRRHLIIA